MTQIPEQQRILEECRNHFLETGEVDPRVRPFIGESWRRCKQYENDAVYHLDVLQESAFHRLLEENRALLHTAHPILMKLVDLVEGTQYAVTLHDRNGWIIDHLFAGDHPIFSINGFNLGIRWAEDTIGTCSSDLAAILDREVQMTGYEHYNERLCGLVGTAAPIHDGEGVVIGVLNMCGYYSSGTSHTLGLVKAMALLVERSMEAARTAQMLKDTFDMMSDGIILLDSKYRVREVSFQAASILKMPQKSVYSLDIRKLFRPEDFEERLQNGEHSFSYAEYELVTGGKIISCSIETTVIMSGEAITGMMLTLRERRAVNRLVNEVAGNRASYSFSDIITQNREMRRQIGTMKDIAATDCCVLIEGESGTGKELFAHALHNASARKNGPFVAVNCASLPRGLVESELFGYEKGAFTGARSEGNPGKFELAEGGTIFLDEIGELPLEIQATLLRVLDNHKVVRIGGRQEKDLNVRVVAATNRNLYREVQQGDFRSDLYFRINVLKFDVPPLRERSGDVPLLAQVFLDRMNQSKELRRKEFSPGFLTMLCAYSWPGNIRELQNVIVRAYYACKGHEITEEQLPRDLIESTQRKSMEEAPQAKRPVDAVVAAKTRGVLAEAERQTLIDALLQSGRNVTKAAGCLGMSRATLYRKVRKYEISLD